MLLPRLKVHASFNQQVPAQQQNLSSVSIQRNQGPSSFHSLIPDVQKYSHTLLRLPTCHPWRQRHSSSYTNKVSNNHYKGAG